MGISYALCNYCVMKKTTINVSLAALLIIYSVFLPFLQVTAQETEVQVQEIHSESPHTSMPTGGVVTSTPTPTPYVALGSDNPTSQTQSDFNHTPTPPMPTPSSSPSPYPTMEPMGGNVKAESQQSGPDPVDNYVNKTPTSSFPHNDPNTGGIIDNIKIQVPQGRNGLQPDLSLIYSNQNTENQVVFGYGWSINIPFIERENRQGISTLYSDNFFRSSLTGQLLLVSTTTSTSTYASRIDNGEFLNYQYSTTTSSWLVTDKNGTRYTFGLSSSTRQDNPSDSTKIYKWMLEEVRDTNDNYIKYQYYKDAGQIYPSVIIYTGSGTTDGIYEVDFLRQSRADTFASFHPNFSVTTNYRINEIDVKVNGTWNKKYAMTYTAGDNGVRSLLSTVTESGQDTRGNVITLPPVSFSYQKATLSGTKWAKDSNFGFLYGANLDYTIVADINGDGISDALESYSDLNATHNNIFINNGHGGWATSTTFASPVTFFDSVNHTYSGARLVDVNGDGLPDILHSYTSYVGGATHTYLNTGSSWEATTTVYAIYHYLSIADAPNIDTRVRFADFNADGLTDIISTYVPNTTATGVYFNSGINFDHDPNWTVPVSDIAKTVQADINGDGLTDIIESYDDRFGNPTRKAYINNGHGWTYDSNYNPAMAFYQEDSNGIPYDLGVRMIDVNGDSLVDMLQSFSMGIYTPLQAAYLNTGHGWSSTSSWIPPVYFGGCGHMTSLIGDADGDNMVDLLHYPSSCGAIEGGAYINLKNKADLLSSIGYSSGATATLVYKSSGEYRDSSNNILNPHVPTLIDTVSAISTSDGLGNWATSTYSYDTGKYYFGDAFDRRFSSFGTTTETDPAGNNTKTYYHGGYATSSSLGQYNDNYWKTGKPYRIEKYDNSGNLYQKTISKWDSATTTSGTTTPAARFVKLVQTVDYQYDGGGTHKDKAEVYSYSTTTGNITQKIEYGEVTGSDDGTFSDTGIDDFATTYSYANSSTSTVTALPSDEDTVDHSSNRVKQVRHYYDNQSLGAVGKGNETKTENWKTASTYINNQKTYNPYGLIATSTDPRGKSTSYSYDTYNLFVATSTNPLNQKTSYLYDYSAGKVATTTDPNGLTFATSFDGLGRPKAIIQPDTSTPSILVTKSELAYTDNVIPSVVQQTDYLNSSTSTNKYVYLDGLKRPIQERSQAEGGDYVAKDYTYNSRGLVATESLPYFSSGSGKTVATTTSSLFATYSYDALSRLASTSNAVGTITNTYTPWKVTLTDARGKNKDLYSDAFKNLIQVDEHNGTSTYSTYYGYNGLGNLINLTDASSSVRHFTYDGLGRRLMAEDLHVPADVSFGTSTYSYDDVGNMIQNITPNGHTINWTYDDVGRQLTEDYTAIAGTEITYGYDSCALGIGHLCYTTTTPANSSYLYNGLGLIKQETKRLSTSTNYTTQYGYDRQGNLTTLIYPDNATLQYSYNSAGLPETISMKEAVDAGYTPVINNFDYSPTRQMSVISYANGATTANTYDPTQLYRLTAKLTIAQSGTSTTNLQNNSYTYDANGNIAQIADTSNTYTAKLLDYTYDDLNRLLTASSTNAATSTNYKHIFSYSPVGNIIGGTFGTTTYAGHIGTSYANPHAPTNINGASLSYDKNGNMTSSANYSNLWNYKNQLIQTYVSSFPYMYAYDYDGARVSYATPTQISYYPNRNYSVTGAVIPQSYPFRYNVTGASSTKQVYAGDQLLATFQGTATTSVNYVHPDHLGGSSIMTNASSTLSEAIDYYPYGATRFDQKQGTFEQTKKFTGHDYDNSTGYTYFGARYYNANNGHFLSEDPSFAALGDEGEVKALTKRSQQSYLSDPQLLNSYSYAKNNPIINIDPDGNIVDTVLDVGFIGYDLYSLGRDLFQGRNPSGSLTSLGLDIGGALIPGVTGLGMMGHLNDVSKTANIAGKAKDFVRIPNGSSLRFSQTTVRSLFNPEGLYKGLTRENMITGLKKGLVDPKSIQIDYFQTSDGLKIMENTRSSASLIQAGIPESQWNLNSVSKGSESWLRIMKHIENNKLSPSGTTKVKINN